MVPRLLGKVAIFLITLVLFFISAEILFKNREAAWIVVIAVMLHEFGHALALIYYGSLPKAIFFVPFLGAAVMPDVEKRKNAPWFSDSFVVLAGPATNILVAGVSFLLLSVWPHLTVPLKASISLNLSLAFINLLPVAFLDGGKFVRAVFASMNEEHDDTLAAIISLLAFVFAVGLILAGKSGMFYAVLITLGVRYASTNDNPADAQSSRAMSIPQAYSLVAIYLVMMLSALVLTTVLPDFSELYPT